MTAKFSNYISRFQGQADTLVGNLPSLLVAADRVAATVAQGVHGRRRAGQGESFWQYRAYEAEDSTHHVDWRRSARSDALYVRENEWEAAQSVWLWSDASPSMQYKSERDLPEKRERADLLTLALGSLLVRGGEQIAPLGRQARPTQGKAAINLLAAALSDRLDPARMDVSESLPPYEDIPKYGRLVLLSDFLEPLEDINRAIGLFADRGVHGHVLQILDPAEQDLPFRGRTEFEGMENEGAALIGRVEGVRDTYSAMLKSHQAGLLDIARCAGWSCGFHVTSNSPESALLSLYTSLAGPQDVGAAIGAGA